MYSLSKPTETPVDAEIREEPLNKRALVLLNRNARQGEEAADKVVGLLKELGIGVLEAQAKAGEPLSEVIVRHRSEVGLVVISGGDGTLNAAMDGVIKAGLPLGIIPLGDRKRPCANARNPHGAGACLQSNRRRSHAQNRCRRSERQMLLQCCKRGSQRGYHPETHQGRQAKVGCTGLSEDRAPSSLSGAALSG